MTTETTVSAAQAADPWASAAATTSSDPWATASSAESTSSWLSNTPTQPVEQSIDWAHPFKDAVIPFDHWVESSLNWLVEHGRPVFQAVRVPIDFLY